MVAQSRMVAMDKMIFSQYLDFILKHFLEIFSTLHKIKGTSTRTLTIPEEQD